LNVLFYNVNFVIIILVKFFFFSVRNLKLKCGLSDVIVKNGGGRMLAQPLLMS